MIKIFKLGIIINSPEKRSFFFLTKRHEKASFFPEKNYEKKLFGHIVNFFSYKELSYTNQLKLKYL